MKNLWVAGVLEMAALQAYLVTLQGNPNVRVQYIFPYDPDKILIVYYVVDSPL